jgi:hypothetical protein
VVAEMTRLVIRRPTNVSLELHEVKDRYPREMRLGLRAFYNEFKLHLNSESEEYFGGFYVLNSRGNIIINNPRRNKTLNIAAELTDCWIAGGKPLVLTIYSKPISRDVIHEIDEELRPDDLKISWYVGAYGFLEKDLQKLIPIQILTDEQHDISRTSFVENVIEKADMLRREFIEVVVEPIELTYVKDAEVKEALQLLLEKQKLLLGAMNGLKKAKTATDFRGVIDEIRRTVENLKLRELYKRICKELLIESPDIEAINEASEEMVEALNEIISGTFHYASRFGIHASTLKKRTYTPIPTMTETEFAVQLALVQLNYLIRLLSTYTVRT